MNITLQVIDLYIRTVQQGQHEAGITQKHFFEPTRNSGFGLPASVGLLSTSSYSSLPSAVRFTFSENSSKLQCTEPQALATKL
jgi:hypothetical protein